MMFLARQLQSHGILGEVSLLMLLEAKTLTDDQNSSEILRRLQFFSRPKRAQGPKLLVKGKQLKSPAC